MKKLIFILFFIPMVIFTQEIGSIQSNIKSIYEMSETELSDYWNKVKKRGYTLEQLKILARSQGVSEQDLKEFEDRIKTIDSKTSDNINKGLEQTQNELSSLFGLNSENIVKDFDKITQPSKLGIFGSSFFNNPSISEAPQINIATPASYELGPGDELLISIWGSAENEYNTKISREGFIKIERIGPIYLSGLSISEAKIKLKNKLSNIYSGLNYNNVFFDVSLLNSRSIIINIIGNAVAPGTYTLSSLISPLNAIYAAGGPTEVGSYRTIKVIRDGKEIHQIDLYNYFVNGIIESFTLKDQDIILIPSYKKRVFLNGEFKTNGIYEVKDDESLEDVLTFSGGISSAGVKSQLSIERVDGLNKVIKSVSKDSYKSFKLFDGDIIESRSSTSEIKNLVEIEGDVKIPGRYPIENAPDVISLINLSGGLNPSAFKSRAYILRSKNGNVSQVISIDLKNLMKDIEEIALEPEDKLIISSNKDLKREREVNIRGQVFDPNVYPFFDGMTLLDLILIAKGLTIEADLKNIEVYRSTFDKSRQNPVVSINVNLNNETLNNIESENNIFLKEDDLVIIRKKEGIQAKEFVFVDGLVKTPGGYSINNNNYSFYDLINDFGGFLPDASLGGVKIKRKVNKNQFQDLSAVEGDSIQLTIMDNQFKENFIEFGVNVDKILSTEGRDRRYNVVLKDGDEITVPKLDNSIEIFGEVQQPSVITHSNSLSVFKAINKAGGFSQNAKKNSVYVVYQNGNVASTKSFLFIKNYPKLKPGSKIIVPKKSLQTNKTSVAEIVGYTTSLVSIIALIKSF